MPASLPCTDVSRAFNDGVDQLRHDVVLALQDSGDLARDPAFDDVDIDLVHVNLRVELLREFGHTKQPLVNVGCQCGRHDCCGGRELGEHG